MLSKAYQPVEPIWLYLLVTGALIAMMTYTWQFRKMPGAKPQVCLQGCKAVWLVSMVLIGVNHELTDKLIAYRLNLLAGVLSPYLWFIFTLEISNQGKLVPPFVKQGYLGIIGCLWLTILSDPWNGLYGQQTWLDGQVLHVIPGYGNLADMLSSYTLSIITLALNVRWIFITAGLRRRQAWWFMMTGLVSLIGIMFENHPGIGWLVPLPLGFLLAGLFVAWGFYRWQVYNILPLAQQVAVRNMFDGLLAVDESGYIVDMNPAAQTILTDLPAAVGTQYEDLVAAWPELAQADDNSGRTVLEVVRELPAGNRFYQLNVTSLQTKGHSLGKAIVFKDITEQKCNQAKLLEREKALSILTERERLGRELHDGQGQQWSYIHMQVEAARTFLEKKDPVQAEALLARLAGVTRDMHVDIRESITGLQLAAATEQGMWQNVEEYLQWFKQNYGIDTVLTVSNEFAARLLSPTTEVQLLRIIQEALTNIRKHAGASQVKVMVKIDGNQAAILVEDNGTGFDFATAAVKKGSFGLKIMQERAAEIRAQFDIRSKSGAGTTIILQVPLAAEASTEPALDRSDRKELL